MWGGATTAPRPTRPVWSLSGSPDAVPRSRPHLPRTSEVWRWAAEQHHALAFSDGHRASGFGFKVFDILENKEKQV